jgi:hypothetical protein
VRRRASSPVVVAALGLACAAPASAPAGAGAGPVRPAASIAAFPARVNLAGASARTIHVTNPGRGPVVVEARPAGFALDLRGRPRVLAATAGARAVTVRPRRLRLAAGATAGLAVTGAPSHDARPGDHVSLVLLTADPGSQGGVPVRMRIGIVVVVRVPGRIVRRLLVRRLGVRRSGATRAVQLWLANQGNVSERLGRGRVAVTLIRRGRPFSVLRPARRELLPRSMGLLELPYRGHVRGPVVARVALVARPSGRLVRRSFRIRL